MVRLSENWDLQELIHPLILERVGERSVDFLHPELVPLLQKMRDRFGAMVVNGTFHGKVFTNSGLREPSSPIGAKLSAHRFGTAADIKFYDTTPEKVQEYITRHQSEFPTIRRMEDAKVTVTWCHIECTSRRTGNIHVFKP